MVFSVKAHHAHHPLTVTKESAKEAFAKAVGWHVVERFNDVSIADDVKTYSIQEFASVMALQEIANTVEPVTRTGAEGEESRAICLLSSIKTRLPI